MYLRSLAIIFSILTFSLKLSAAPASNRLYHNAYKGWFGHIWDVFVLIQGDTAISENLSDIKGQLQIGGLETDTLIKQSVNFYVGRRHTIIIQGDTLHFTEINSRKNRTLTFVSANDSICKIWSARHNRLVDYDLYREYLSVRIKVESDTIAIAKLESAYNDFTRKIYTLDRETFLKESVLFKSKYLKH
jgi:hypothetical protein